jgi:hypothetical protein
MTWPVDFLATQRPALALSEADDCSYSEYKLKGTQTPNKHLGNLSSHLEKNVIGLFAFGLRGLDSFRRLPLSVVHSELERDHLLCYLLTTPQRLVYSHWNSSKR